MPYYCTVPRCTSMAGKAKNVSFHQFPRDQELAKLWNEILKRGKPYTKYSKVCSLHFTPEDYTITSVGKNKGQWRTLRKDAIPSRNLPSESPSPYQRKQWSGWNHSPTSIMDPTVQQQMAQAIYIQTMLAMQSSSADMLSNGSTHNEQPAHTSDSEIVKELVPTEKTSYKCAECSKCFKDPDVYLLHKRTHLKNEKENFNNTNVTLQANPILANLLKTNNDNPILDQPVSVESLVMSALVNLRDGYMRNLTSMIKNGVSGQNGMGHRTAEFSQDPDNSEDGHDNYDLSDVNNKEGLVYDQDKFGQNPDNAGHSQNKFGQDKFDLSNVHYQDNLEYGQKKFGQNYLDSDQNPDNSGHSKNTFGQNNDGNGSNDELESERYLNENKIKFCKTLGLDQNGSGNGHNDNYSSSDSDSFQDYHKIRDELNAKRGNSDNISDSKLYKSSSKGRNGFDNYHNDNYATDSVTISTRICDSDLNESVDSDNLIIDET